MPANALANTSTSTKYRLVAGANRSSLGRTAAAAMAGDSIEGSKHGRDCTRVISSFANLAIQYNFQAIPVALLLTDSEPGPVDNSTAAFPRTETVGDTLSSVVFAGAIVGQLSMGIAGDLCGRKRALILTNLFTAIGALCSALCAWGPSATVYTVITVSRFVLGVGVGGKYPLAGTVASEGGGTGHSKSKSAVEVAMSFFWQTPGTMLPYAVGMVFLAATQLKDVTDVPYLDASIGFRVVLGIGALPALVVVILTWCQPDNAMTAFKRPSLWKDIKAHPQYWRVLMGTGGSWLLYDFLYYGTSLNQPQIIENAFGSADSAFSIMWQNLLAASVGIPGIVLAIVALPRLGSKALQAYGFVLLAVVCGAMAVLNFVAPDTNSTSPGSNTSAGGGGGGGASPWVQFGLFCALVFALNWGPNVSTYVLPPQSFPPAVRSSFFGLSAAMGKFGALLGGFCFQPLADALGYGWLFVICGGVALVGVLLTHVAVAPYNVRTFVPDIDTRDDDDTDGDLDGGGGGGGRATTTALLDHVADGE